MKGSLSNYCNYQEGPCSMSTTSSSYDDGCSRSLRLPIHSLSFLILFPLYAILPFCLSFSNLLGMLFYLSVHLSPSSTWHASLSVFLIILRNLYLPTVLGMLVSLTLSLSVCILSALHISTVWFFVPACITVPCWFIQLSLPIYPSIFSIHLPTILSFLCLSIFVRMYIFVQPFTKYIFFWSLYVNLFYIIFDFLYFKN